MNNVIQFPQRAKQVEAQDDIRPMATVTTLPSRAAEAAESMAELVEAVKDAANTAVSMVVMRTLKFYAEQGWDGGAKARQAIAAMHSVISANDVKA